MECKEQVAGSFGRKFTILPEYLSQMKMVPQSDPETTYSDLWPKKFTDFTV